MIPDMSFGPMVVAIPARDEADSIGACLEALNNQFDARLDHIVLVVNNTTDDTVARARAMTINSGTTLHVIECTLPPEHANAGFARRMAMEQAALLAGCDGILLTTDADAQVDPDWVAANLAAIRAGADVVAGWVELDPIDWGMIPLRLHEDDAQECAYDMLCDSIHARLDPDPADPTPRHTQHSGASLAVTAAAYARSGGVPLVESGEDRAFVEALRRIDGRVRHAPEVHVTVSGRIDGRSVGGMADTIRRRLLRPDPFLDDRLEPAVDCARRAWCRGELRRAYNDPAFDLRPLADRLGMPARDLARLLSFPYFGAAWSEVEEMAPALRRRKVRACDVGQEIAAARLILEAALSPTWVSG